MRRRARGARLWRAILRPASEAQWAVGTIRSVHSTPMLPSHASQPRRASIRAHFHPRVALGDRPYIRGGPVLVVRLRPAHHGALVRGQSGEQGGGRAVPRPSISAREGQQARLSGSATAAAAGWLGMGDGGCALHPRRGLFAPNERMAPTHPAGSARTAAMPASAGTAR